MAGAPLKLQPLDRCPICGKGRLYEMMVRQADAPTEVKRVLQCEELACSYRVDDPAQKESGDART